MIQEVGLENLPNSYINMIEISEFSSGVNVLHTHFILKDVRNDGLFSWYNRDELGKYLKLLVVASTNEEINTAINNGEIPLDKKKISSHSSFNPTQVQFREIKVGWDKKQKLINGTQTPEGELFEFEFGSRFYIRNSEPDLRVYCASYIDIVQFSQDYKLDLEHSLINSYTGPIASERVFSNGALVRDSYLFRTAQNTIWSGPVRFLNGTYYSGSKGEINPSGVLIRFRVSNTKIKDYRRPKLIKILPSKVDNKLPPFPEPLFSYNPDGSLSALFAVDVRSLLLKHTKFAKRLAIIDEKLLQKVMQQVKFDKIKVTKQKIITKPTNTKAGTKVKQKSSILYSKTLANTKDSSPFNLIPTESNEAKFEEIVLSTNPEIRHFALRDYNDYKSKGEYEYVLEVEFEDPVTNYVDFLGKEVQKNLADIKNYVTRSQKPANQNDSRTRFTDDFVVKELGRFGPGQQPWNKAAQLFSTYYSMFLDINQAKAKEIAETSVAKIHPSFATPLSIQNFIKEYFDLHNHFIRFFRPRIKRISNIKGKSNKGRSSDQNKVMVKSKYKEPVVHDDRDSTIIYYNFKDDIYPVITIKEYISRNQEETGKFYNSKPSLAGTNLSKMSKKAAEKLANDATKSTGFLTPMKIKAKKANIDLRNPATVDIGAFNEVFNKANKKKVIQKVNPKPVKKSKLKIKSAKKIDKYLEKTVKETKTVEQNVGKTSKFRSADINLKPFANVKIKNKIKNKIKSKAKKKVTSKQFLADSKNMKEMVKNIDKVRLPPSLISVMASESKSTKNNTLTSKADIAAGPETKDFFAIMYTNPVQIETLQGYRKDARGRDIYNSPIWGLLKEEDLETDNPIICRFTMFNTKMFETQGFEINIANDSFILQPESSITKDFNTEGIISQQDILDIIEETEQSDAEYQTSNIVTQSIDKDGPLR
jgi:hypothetical protein